MIRRQPLRRLTPLRRTPFKRSTKASRPKPKPITFYKKKLWEVFSRYIRQRWADASGFVACVSCGKRDHWKNMDAGHYIPKSLGLSIYFHEKNVNPQCTGCNRFRHGNLAPYALWLINTYGPNILSYLDKLRHETRKISQAEYLELISEYENKIKKLTLPEAA